METPFMKKLTDDARGTRSFTLGQWCDKRQVSKAEYYKLKALNLAPRAYYVGARVYISDEADAAWLRDREAAA
jgi:hypothetical protein